MWCEDDVECHDLLPQPFQDVGDVHEVGLVVAGQRVHHDVDAGALGEFALALAGAVIVSGFVALTLSPVQRVLQVPVDLVAQGGLYLQGLQQATAAQQQAQRELAELSEKAARAAMEHGLRRVEVQVKGPGSGRDTAVRSIQNTGIEVTSIKDVTPVPHNGCRQPKRRRT